MQIKRILRFHFSSVRMTKINKRTANSAGGDKGEMEPSLHAFQPGAATVEISAESSQRNKSIP